MAAALVAAVGFFQAHDGRGARGAAPVEAGSPGLVLTGFLDSTGIDLERLEVRCSSMRLDEHPTPRVAELDSTGRFVISGLADVDYCVEIVVRTNPALVLARKEFVRPGGDELVLTSDPSVLFGPEAKAEEQ